MHKHCPKPCHNTYMFAAQSEGKSLLYTSQTTGQLLSPSSIANELLGVIARSCVPPGDFQQPASATSTCSPRSCSTGERSNSCRLIMDMDSKHQLTGQEYNFLGHSEQIKPLCVLGTQGGGQHLVCMNANQCFVPPVASSSHAQCTLPNS